MRQDIQAEMENIWKELRAKGPPAATEVSQATKVDWMFDQVMRWVAEERLEHALVKEHMHGSDEET